MAAPNNNPGSSYILNDVSIAASNGVHAAYYRAFSDARIKEIQGRSDSPSDLKTLTGIKITDFRYKDKLSKGDALVKKVIAQQVERVFPQAVSLNVGVVPDIFKSWCETGPCLHHDAGQGMSGCFSLSWLAPQHYPAMVGSCTARSSFPHYCHSPPSPGR